ncbi:Hypothetical protein A7982_05729 [Minicystis rosea]|nr:Hypothetical protein A7982_05729 [Minicystis rosea]
MRITPIQGASKIDQGRDGNARPGTDGGMTSILRNFRRARALALAFSSSLALVLLACGSEGNGSTTSTGGGGGTAPTNSTSSSGGAVQAPWSYGNPQDEEAYCKLYSKAEAVLDDCTVSPELESSRLATCAKYLPCYRVIFEPDFLERTRSCLEDQLACKVPYTESCEENAGATYPDGAQLRLSCEARHGQCKSMGQNFDIGCQTLGALEPGARQRVAKCFTQATPCTDAEECMLIELGPPCDAL